MGFSLGKSFETTSGPITHTGEPSSICRSLKTLPFLRVWLKRVKYDAVTPLSLIDIFFPSRIAGVE